MDRKVLQTSIETRKAIIALHSRGLRRCEVARQLGISTRTVWLWVKRYRATASLEDYPRGGRPRGTKAHDDKVISEAIKADPFITAVDIKEQYNLTCSAQTIRNRMLSLKRGRRSSAMPSPTKNKPSGASSETTSPSCHLVPPLPASSSLPNASTTLIKTEPGSGEETLSASSTPLSPIQSSLTASHGKEMEENVALNCGTNSTNNEKANMKPEPTWEERPEWTTVWIKREEEDNDFKVDVQDEAMETEDRTSSSVQGGSGSNSGNAWMEKISGRYTPSPFTSRRPKFPRVAPLETNSFEQEKVAPIDSPKHGLGPDASQATPFIASHFLEGVCPYPEVILSETEEKSSVLSNSERESSSHVHSDSEESEDWELHPKGTEALPVTDIFLDSDSSSVESEEEEDMEGVAPPQEKITDVPWTWVKGNFPPDLYPFDASNSGVSDKVRITEDSSELDCFVYFFDTTLMGLIKRETNKQYLYASKKSKWCAKEWQDVTVNELYMFFGLCMVMPHINNGETSDIWSSVPGIQAPSLFKFIPEARYRMIARMLHFSSNYVHSKDPLAKIRPVYTHLKNRFKEVMNPFKNVVIDESQLLFKSRLAFRHSIPSKEHNYEAKTYVLCDCKTGFVMDFLIYSSRVTEGAGRDPHGTSGAIVKRLLEPLYGRGHTLFVGSWATSPQLFHYLLTKKVGACGMVRPDHRSCPQFESVPRGQNVQYHANNVLAVKWHYRTKKEHLLSTVHGRDTSQKNKPQPFTDFDSNTKRFGISDTQIFFEEPEDKVVKWYKKLFYHLLDLTILNAYVLYVVKTGTRPHYQTFHRRLIKQIFERFGGEVPRVKPKTKTANVESLPIRFQLSKGHFPRLLIQKPDENKPQRNCYVCISTTRRPRKTRSTGYYCSICNVALCIVPCFERYHTVKEY